MHTRAMSALVSPRSITVVGGGDDLAKPGGRVVWSLRRKAGPRLSVVNPKGGIVQGLPTFTDVAALPEVPELAIISVPARQVIPTVGALSARGTKAFVVLSCGFSELDEAGRALERQLVEVVREGGGCLIGPNSLGVFTPHYVGTFGGPELEPESGSIDFISASGSTAAFIMEAGLERGLRFASLVSVGNSAMCGVEDVLGHQARTFSEAPVKAKLLYLESMGDPQALLQHARDLRAQGCHVVALKAGVTEAGARAASSHTGAIASRDAAVSALFDKAGIVRVSSKTEMVDVAGVLTRCGAPRGRSIAIVTHAGGPGILLADELSKHGFQLPALLPATRDKLARLLPAGCATANPIDFLASGTSEHLRSILQILATDEIERFDAVCVVFGSPGLFDIWPVLEQIIEASSTLPIPIYPILPSVRTAASEAKRFREAGHFYFTDEVALARALGTIARTPAPEPDTPPRIPIDVDAISQVLGQAAPGSQLGPVDVDRVLRACGFSPPPSEVVTSAAEAGEAAARIGFPVVLKVVGPNHKTDVGGVMLNLASEGEVQRGTRRMLQIEGATGVLVQRQVSGVELILGVSREGAFGHLLLFGMGGVYAEALADVAMALAPLSDIEARRMIGRIRGQAMLRGTRGLPPVDLDALGLALRRLSSLVQAFPAVAELDINPLIVSGSELWAADARITVSGARCD